MAIGAAEPLARHDVPGSLSSIRNEIAVTSFLDAWMFGALIAQGALVVGVIEFLK